MGLMEQLKILQFRDQIKGDLRSNNVAMSTDLRFLMFPPYLYFNVDFVVSMVGIRRSKVLNGPQTNYPHLRVKTAFEANTLKIGEISKKTDTPIVTLRFYEKQKLIIPQKNPDKQTLHRRYSRSVVAEIEYIKLCRNAGFGLPEISSMLKLFRGFRPPAKLLMAAVYRTLERTRNQVKSLEEVERIMLMRMRDPQGDIEKLINEDSEIWRLRGLKMKAD